MTASGIVQIHSASAALRPHVEWAVEAAFGMPIPLRWQPQPSAAGQFKCEFPWRGVPGIVDKLGSALISCRQIRFEIIEDAPADGLGRRVCFTPSLGVFNGVTNELGDLIVDENRLRTIMGINSSALPLAERLEELLGRPWDDELEVFRHGQQQVRWLHAVS